VSEPFALLPFAVAAHRGKIDTQEAGPLVAAGLTLLRRHAPLVRALHGRRAAILLHTSPAYLTALAAADGRGAVLLSPLAAPPEISAQIADAGVGAVFTSRALAERLPSGVPKVFLDEAPRRAHVSIGGASSDVDLGAHDGLDLDGDPDAPGRDEEACVVYTSAMAGRPLGAILTHRNLLANARSAVAACACTADDHVLALLPFSHLFGLTVTAIAPLLVGARITTMARFDAALAIELIETRAISLLVGVPAAFAALTTLLEHRSAPRPLPGLRACICGGAPLPREWQDRWTAATGVELRQGYGLTEAGPVCLFNDVRHANQRGTLGIPFPGVEVRIAEERTGAAVADGAVGEICVRGDNVSPGYVSDGNVGLARRDGWLRTGDRGVRHAGGAVSFAGVLKQMFTRGGFNIFPAEVERAVGELPGVRAVRVRAIPDAIRENEIALAIEGDVTEAEVRAWCAARLSAYKQPGRIEIS
jgi:long-chain acyl-CoA synthetase